MGFTLSIAQTSTMVPRQVEEEFLAWLESRNDLIRPRFLPVAFNEGFPFVIDCVGEERQFEDGELIEMDSLDYILCHAEVPWGWWDSVVTAMTETLGSNRTLACTHMHAFWSVAVPFSIDNSLLGEPTLRRESSRSFASKLFSVIKPKDREHDPKTIDQRAGSLDNLRIGSIPRILSELEEACTCWHLPNDESEARAYAEKLYVTVPEDNQSVAHCYALIARSFLRYALEKRHLVWFVK